MFEVSTCTRRPYLCVLILAEESARAVKRNVVFTTLCASGFDWSRYQTYEAQHKNIIH